MRFLFTLKNAAFIYTPKCFLVDYLLVQNNSFIVPMQTQIEIFFLNINMQNHIKFSLARQESDLKNSMHEHFRSHDFLSEII